MITFFNRIGNGFQIVLQALRLFALHKFLWIFIASATALKFFLVTLCLPDLYHVSELFSVTMIKQQNGIFSGTLSSAQGTALTNLILLLLIVFPLINSILSFALCRHSAGLLQNSQPKFTDSLRYAFWRTPGILMWIFINLIVGLVIGLIRGKNENKNATENNVFGINILRNFAANIVGVTWSIATFLTIPAMAVGKASAIGGIKESYKLIKNRFGESTTAMVSLQLISAIASLPIIGIIILLYMTTKPQALAAAGNYSIALNPYLLGLSLITTLFATEIIRTAQILMRTAVYLYATNQSFEGFDKELIKNSFSHE